MIIHQDKQQFLFQRQKQRFGVRAQGKTQHLQDEHIQSIQPPGEAQEEDTHPSSDQLNLFYASESQGWGEWPFHLGKILLGSLWQSKTKTCTSSLTHRDLYFSEGFCLHGNTAVLWVQVSAAQRIPERSLSSAHAAKSTSLCPGWRRVPVCAANSPLTARRHFLFLAVCSSCSPSSSIAPLTQHWAKG